MLKSYTKDQSKMKLNQDGFTLIELMVAITIFAVGLLSIAGMQITSINSNTTSLQRTEAASLAQDEMEFLFSLPLSDARFNNNNQVVDNNRIGSDGGSYSLTSAVTLNVPSAGLARLDVQALNNANNNINIAISSYKRLR